MPDTVADVVHEILAELETALRDSAIRAVEPGLPYPLALGFFRTVIALARSVMVFRRRAGLPSALSTELVLILGAVHLCAARRRHDPGMTDDRLLRINNAMVGLSRAVLQALPLPEKPKKPAAKPVAAVKVPPPAPPPLRRRPNDWDNIGAIAIRAMDAETPRTPLEPDALQKAMAEMGIVPLAPGSAGNPLLLTNPHHQPGRQQASHSGGHERGQIATRRAA